MKNTKLQTLTSIAAVIRKYKKNYCFASQAKIIELLKTFHNTEIKARALNYHLADLREWGLIKSIKRSKRNDDGTVCLKTSATCITPTGYKELWKLGCEWAKKMYESLIRKYNPKLTQEVKQSDQEWEAEAWSRREQGRAMFKDPAFRAAFDLD